MPKTIGRLYGVQKNAPSTPVEILPEADTKSIFGAFTIPIGVEIEIEGSNFKIPVKTCWSLVEDFSLKDNGIEFRSTVLVGRQIDYALNEIDDELSKATFSHRTSIHVHIGVERYSLDFVRFLLKAYQTVENLLFSYADQLRQGNPYCYPINDLVNKSILFEGSSDSKYAALNVGASLREHNSIEFRHLEGTNNTVKIKRWIYILLTFFRNVRKMYYAREKIPYVYNREEYQAWTKKLFGPAVRYLPNNVSEEDIMFDIIAANKSL